MCQIELKLRLRVGAYFFDMVSSRVQGLSPLSKSGIDIRHTREDEFVEATAGPTQWTVYQDTLSFGPMLVIHSTRILSTAPTP